MAVTFSTGFAIRKRAPRITPSATARTAPRPTSTQLGPFCILRFPMGGWLFLRGDGRRRLVSLGRGGGRRLAGRRLGHALVLVVGDIEPASLEDQPGTAAYQALQGHLVAFR